MNWRTSLHWYCSSVSPRNASISSDRNNQYGRFYNQGDFSKFLPDRRNLTREIIKSESCLRRRKTELVSIINKYIKKERNNPLALNLRLLFVPLKIVRTLASQEENVNVRLPWFIDYPVSFPGRFQLLLNCKGNARGTRVDCSSLSVIWFSNYRLSRNATYNSWEGLIVISLG